MCFSCHHYAVFIFSEHTDEFEVYCSLNLEIKFCTTTSTMLTRCYWPLTFWKIPYKCFFFLSFFYGEPLKEIYKSGKVSSRYSNHLIISSELWREMEFQKEGQGRRQFCFRILFASLMNSDLLYVYLLLFRGGAQCLTKRGWYTEKNVEWLKCIALFIYFNVITFYFSFDRYFFIVKFKNFTNYL